MNIAIGSDHAGFELKQILINELREIDDQVTDQDVPIGVEVNIVDVDGPYLILTADH